MDFGSFNGLFDPLVGVQFPRIIVLNELDVIYFGFVFVPFQRMYIAWRVTRQRPLRSAGIANKIQVKDVCLFQLNSPSGFILEDE